MSSVYRIPFGDRKELDTITSTDIWVSSRKGVLKERPDPFLQSLPSYRDIRGTAGASSPFCRHPAQPGVRLAEQSPSDPLFGVST